MPSRCSDNDNAEHNCYDPRQSKRGNVFPQDDARRDNDANKLQRRKALGDVQRQNAYERRVADERYAETCSAGNPAPAQYSEQFDILRPGERVVLQKEIGEYSEPHHHRGGDDDADHVRRLRARLKLLHFAARSALRTISVSFRTCASSPARGARVDTDRPVDNIMRSGPDLFVDAPDIFADDPCADELYAAQEQDENRDRRDADRIGVAFQ